MVRELVEKVVEIYNRYRSPEATAELVEVSESEAIVVFRGSFCRTCGVIDWIEDFCYVAKDLGLECRLENVAELGEGVIAAKFRIHGGEHR